jgi:hypothetical protein
MVDKKNLVVGVIGVGAGGGLAYAILKPNPPVPAQCLEGDSMCVGLDLYECVNGVMTLTGPNSAYCGPTPPPPDPGEAVFELSGMVISPSVVKLGGVVQVSFIVTNIGTAAGNYDFDLIRPAPLPAVSFRGYMTAGASTQRSTAWYAQLEGLGLHTIVVGNISGSYSVIEEDPPDPPPVCTDGARKCEDGKEYFCTGGQFIEVSPTGFCEEPPPPPPPPPPEVTAAITSMDAPLSVEVNQAFTVTVYWQNTSTVPVQGRVVLAVEGAGEIGSPTVVLGPGATHDEPFDITFLTEAYYTISATLMGEEA